jgi:lysophospholipase
LARNAKDISDGEKEFVKKRHNTTDKALADFFKRANLSDFDVDGFFADYSPVVSLAFSGGGYRAMLSGAGAVKAMDSRTPNSTGPNQIGGLLQGASYFSGLSGGSWLLGSIFVNNFTTIGDLQASSNLWDLTNSVLAPYGSSSIVDTLKYYRDLRREVTSKEDAGFEVTLTDYWGRALSRQFVNATKGGPAVTWSSIALTDQYKNAEFPFPLVVADGRALGETIISSNTTVYEFNPLEFGSFDPSLFAFTPIEYIGSNLTGGAPAKKDVCFRGFDNAG